MCVPASKAKVIEPRRLIAGEPQRQDLGFPSDGRCFEAFKLRDDIIERPCAFHAGIRCRALPTKQEAQEVAGGDRLDLGAQPLHGVLMNARQQAPLAPFLALRRRSEPPAHGEAFDFERCERTCELRRRDTEGGGKRILRDRA